MTGWLQSRLRGLRRRSLLGEFVTTRILHFLNERVWRSLLTHSGRRAASMLVTTLFGLGSWMCPVAAEQTIDFNRDVRPILSENCFHCHGPDANARQADLRLDNQEGAHEYVVVPGDPSASEMVARITASHPDARMPPPKLRAGING